MTRTPRLPPGQQLAARDKWPQVGERAPADCSAPWTLQIAGEVESPRELSFEQLLALPRVSLALDIHCVTRWSKFDLRFAGVSLADVLSLANPTRAARFVSFVARSAREHSTSLPLPDALALGAVLATHCDGAPLPREHGGPLRAVVPDRYFYKSLKWLSRIDVLSEDRLGYWESQAGYHNHADPWREERFIASSLSKQEAAQILNARDFAGRELLGLDASGRDLSGLRAAGARLRNADFAHCSLVGADFRGANLSNARFHAADLRDACLVDADLEGADFSGASLAGADLQGASLTAATFCSSSGGARFDAETKVAASQLEALMPGQLEFVSVALREAQAGR